MSTDEETALIHLADFLAVGAHATLSGAVPSLLSLEIAPASWPVTGNWNTPGDRYQEAVTNATTAHLLDWDDVMLGVPTHPGVIIWPALLASARTDATVRSLTTGFMAGLGVISELCEVLGVEHYSSGWHATTTIGRMAASYAAALSRYGDSEIAWRALQLAATGCAGVTDVFGTSAKPVQVGMAAGGATHAALLAPGVTDMPDVLLPTTRLGKILGVKQVPRRRRDYEGESVASSLRIKAYPCCYFAHAPVLAALEVSERRVSRGQTSEITVRIGPDAAKICGVVVPTTIDEARFCLPYLVAAAEEYWTDGALGLLDGSLLTSSSVAKRARDVVIVVDSRIPEMGAVVTANGESASVDLGRPDPGVRAQLVAAKAKSLPDSLSSSILACLSNLPEERERLLRSPVAILSAPLT